MRRSRGLMRVAALMLAAASVFAAAGTRAVPALSQMGSRGSQVRRVQQRLISLGYLGGTADGVFGTKTQTALTRFQSDKGLDADGVAGVVTLTALDFVFRQGDSGEDVAAIQKKLSALGYYTGAADGIFGSATAAAVRSFQAANGLTQDSVVGFATAKKLYSSSAVRKSSSQPYRDNDYELLARIISAEARGEPYRGQVAVGAVVLNRVKHPSFPDTVAGVIYQNGAFTAITDGQIHEEVYESSYRAAREALAGSDPTGGAIYYYNPDKTSNRWIRSRTVIAAIGNHLFCS